MDRSIVYTASIPRSADILQAQTNAMYAMGSILGAAVGTGTYIDGLGVTVGAGVSVNVGSGCIIQSALVDSGGVAYGSLPLDSNTIMKIGLLTTSFNIALVAPGTAGFSINYLIEAQLQEADDLPVVLNYYNATTPSVPFTGPGNSGASQNTRRKQIVALQLKAGAGATTGTQATPGADSGWVPLSVITVSQGDAVVQASKIYRAPSAPFLGTKVGQLRTKLLANLTLYVTTGGNDSTNNGLSTNVAFATPQAAWNSLINSYDLNGFSATINIGAGTFTALNCSGQPTGVGASSAITITGAGSSTILNSTGLASAVNGGTGVVIIATNLQVTGTYGITATSGSQVTLGGGLTFGACSVAHITSSGIVVVFGGYSITGAAPVHWFTGNGGSIQVFGTPTVTGSGALAFSTAFAQAATGNINATGVAFSGTGSFTGTRYSVTLGGSINTNGGGATFLPGSVAGTGSGTTGYYG